MRHTCQILLATCGTVLLAQSPSALATERPHIEIVTGMYGKPDARHVLDIATRVQDLCGPSSQRCDVSCSESSFGRTNLGRKPICRVTYRCGADYVRSVEAWREEPILLRCPERREDMVTPPPPLAN